MNYYQPRQQKTNGLWHYTCRNDNSIWPGGYCANGCLGHTTEADACAHYKQYVLDERTSIHKYDNQQRRCDECGEFTQFGVSIEGWPSFTLCEKHQGRPILEKLYSVGESISS